MKTADKRRAELEALARLPDSEIDFSDIPEQTNWSGAVRGKFYRPKQKADQKDSAPIRLLARTGDPCPESGIWVVVGQVDIAVTVAAGHLMPPAKGSAVTWRLDSVA